MSLGGPSPLGWAFFISILIHIFALPLANFDDNLLDSETNKQLINITLEPIEQRSDPRQSPLAPVPRTRSPEPILRSAENPNNIVPPEVKDLPNLPKLPNPNAPTPKTQPISKAPSPSVLLPSERESNISLNEPDPINKAAPPNSPEAIPTTNQQITQDTPPPPQLPKALSAQVPQQDREDAQPEVIPRTNQQITQATPPPPQLPKALSPQVPQQDREDIQSATSLQVPPTIQDIPPEIDKPLPQKSTVVKETVVEEFVEETTKNDSGILTNAVAREYAETLHSTLDKRVKRLSLRSLRKAIQNCIEGTVRVRIQISPSGEQLSYEILNPSQAPSILRNVTEQLLNRQKDFSAFNEDLSNQAMMFEVNLVYQFQQCAK